MLYGLARMNACMTISPPQRNKKQTSLAESFLRLAHTMGLVVGTSPIVCADLYGWRKRTGIH